MSYLTKGNVSKIIVQVDISNLPANFADMKGNVYKREIWFLSNMERNKLLLRKELQRNPTAFIEFYKKLQKKPDSYRYIHEGGTPAFHSRLDCERLISDFTAFEIPLPIQERGADAVTRFRAWFNQNKELFESNPEAFYGRMVAAFGINEVIKQVRYDNSGVEFRENLNLAELEDVINDLIMQASKFIVNISPLEQTVIKRFGKLTFLAYTKREIANNDTGFSDEQLKEFLKKFADDYKVPITKCLEEYYRVYFNPELKFNGALLEELGFKRCSSCHDSTTIII